MTATLRNVPGAFSPRGIWKLMKAVTAVRIAYPKHEQVQIKHIRYRRTCGNCTGDNPTTPRLFPGD